jgi:hypothetical protein
MEAASTLSAAVADALPADLKKGTAAEADAASGTERDSTAQAVVVKASWTALLKPKLGGSRVFADA